MRDEAGTGWWNVDADPAAPADAHYTFPPIAAPDASVDEVYLGHVLEHFEPDEAADLLAECRRVLVPGGALGVVVPNTRKVLAHYLAGDHTEVEVPEREFWNLDDLDAVCRVFLFSTIQPSRHRWAYDARTLLAALERAGFHVEDSIRPDDPRLSSPQWWDLGYHCIKRERRT
jgi:predicted SAM-dependent methyltransferase